MRNFRRQLYESHMSRSTHCQLGQICPTGTQRAFIPTWWHDESRGWSP